ncbi:hypothetical protein V6Z12_A12G256600 [Gossypium hirsutum]
MSAHLLCNNKFLLQLSNSNGLLIRRLGKMIAIKKWNVLIISKEKKSLKLKQKVNEMLNPETPLLLYTHCFYCMSCYLGPSSESSSAYNFSTASLH